jgi:hypothetical protein
MAAPGYPQMPMGGPPMGGPPMGGPPMGGPPMGGPPMGMQRPMKRGMSKAVPIVVSAGLAVGVFCGLLFGVGKKNDAVAAAPSSGSNVKEEPKPETGAAPAGASTTPTQGSAAVAPTVAAGSAAPAAGSAAPTATATPAVAEKKMTKLIVVVKTPGAAKDAKLIVDGAPVEGLTTELPVDKKTAKIEVKASGYRSYEKKLDLTPGELTLEIEMAKRSSSSGGTPSVKPPKRPDKPPSGGGGLIDI